MRLWLLVLFLGVSAHAETLVDIFDDTPVYQATAPGARVLFYLHAGDTVYTTPARNKNYLRIRTKRKGKWAAGFIEKYESVKGGDGDASSRRASRAWGFGGGFEYTGYKQAGKTFQTEDQVRYVTTEYTSTSASPFLSVQMGGEDFWRFALAYRRTHYTASAKTDVIGASAKSVDLEQSFVSGILQKAWTPFRTNSFYFGVGGEAAKAFAVTINLGGKDLPVTSSDFPVYLGGLAFAGGELTLTRTLTLYGEGRIEYIANQSPGILAYQAALGLLYWP